MIAMIALFATVLPKVGPIVSKLKLLRAVASGPGRAGCAGAAPGVSVSVEIWKPLPPVTSLPLRLLDLGVAEARSASARERTPSSSAVLTSAVLMRVPGLEVDAEVQALAADRERADQQDHARQRRRTTSRRP